MKVLVTAGNTMAMIDKVRGISNVFRGKTGNMIARELKRLGHSVTLLTSSPHPHDIYVGEVLALIDDRVGDLAVIPYKTYDELMAKMEYAVKNGGFDVVIHSAAVSDYLVRDVYIPALPGEGPNYGDGRVVVKPLPKKGKFGSNHKRLFLELVPTEKIVDKIRRDWGFKGVLVKFKLEVDLTDSELIEIARASRVQSDADMIVANCYEWSRERAYVIGRDGVAKSVKREQIASEILRRVA